MEKDAAWGMHPQMGPKRLFFNLIAKLCALLLICKVRQKYLCNDDILELKFQMFEVIENIASSWDGVSPKPQFSWKKVASWVPEPSSPRQHCGWNWD